MIAGVHRCYHRAMATTATAFADGQGFARDRVSVSAAPWSIYAVLFASTSVILGVMWDISWHRTIGRDTFWTPAHLGIYLGGVLAGLTSGWVALQTTFAGTESDRGTAVRFWGFRAPLGAWVCIWGAFAMVTSAPFDDWWHNAYGLDVKIISPPHMILAAGFFGIELGTVMLMLAFMNRATGQARRALQWLFLYVGGTVLCESLLLKLEYISRSDMHSALFYVVVAIGTPAVLAGIAVASGQRWACTILAAVYTAQARYAEATTFFQRSLTIRQRYFGANDPRVATTLCGLAELALAQGQHAEEVGRTSAISFIWHLSFSI